MMMNPSKFAFFIAIVAMACSTALAQIKITEFKTEHMGEGKLKITLSAEGSKEVNIGSYCVRFDQVQPYRPVKSLPDFQPGISKTDSAYLYVFSTDFGKPGPYLKDNGQKDEDPRPGYFAYTIDSSSWPEGKYLFSVAAMNRPSEGNYYDDARVTSITVGHPDLKAEISNVEGAKNVVIYRKEGVYACFPSLTQLTDGRLLTEFGTLVRASHIDGTGGNAHLVSSDGGQTWTTNTEPDIHPNWRTKDGSLVKAAADGWIYVSIDQKDRLEKEGRITLIANEKSIAYLGDAYFSTSSDDGKTWVRHEIEIPDDIAGLMNHHLNASECITKSGVRLVAIYGKRKGHTRDEEFFLRSADDGRTWTFVEMTPGGMGDSDSGVNETALAALPNGDVLAMCRPDPDGYLHSSISHDDGLTWSKPKKTDIWGYPADLLVLPDGRILCAYGYRRPPMGIRASISSDNGRSWDLKNELIIRADGLAAGGDLGYPLLAQRADGQIFCIYYISTDGGFPGIEGTIFPVPAAK